MQPAIGVAQAMYDPKSDAVLVLHRHPAPVNGSCEQICGRWVSKSTDDGSSFSDPVPAGKGDIGATWGSGLAHGIALRSGRLAAQTASRRPISYGPLPRGTQARCYVCCWGRYRRRRRNKRVTHCWLLIVILNFWQLLQIYGQMWRSRLTWRLYLTRKGYSVL